MNSKKLILKMLIYWKLMILMLIKFYQTKNHTKYFSLKHFIQKIYECKTIAY